MRTALKHSIRQKFIVALTGVAAVTVLAASLVFYRQIVVFYRESYRHDLASRASIIGANCSAALTFSLPDDARVVLASLKADPSIIAASIHDHQGRLFACLNEPCREEIPYLDGQTIMVKEEIILDGRAIGEVALVDDLRHVREFQREAMLSLFVILSVGLASCALLVRYIGKRLTAPLLELAALAGDIAEGQNYQLRATIHEQDEVGAMARAFNAMLARIDSKTMQLVASERRFRTLVEQGVDAFFLHDETGRLVDVNQSACESLGYSRAEILTMTVADIDGESVPRQDREKIWAQLTPGVAMTLTSRHKRRDGSTFPVEVRLGLLELEGERFIMGLARDISGRLAEIEARHAVELQLQQAQKMESIGTLAGGIAHDFNNILSAVIGFTELTVLLIKDNPAALEHLAQVRKAAERATALVKQILTFSRKQQQEKSPLQISLVVKEALKLLRASIPTTIEIRQEIVSQGLVLADPTQIHQVVMNLCTNAYHAMLESGGVLAVNLKEIKLDQAQLDNTTELPPGQYLKLSVSDNGCGIAKENLPKIFEPYFTTKEKGRGTGLGLAVVHGVVKEHQGRISVYSEPGQGTTFNVYLPLLISELDAVAAKVLPPPMSKGHERIMVVDDEAPIREVISQFLVQAGYRVDLFANGLEAWEALSQSPEAWRLLLTDQTMPGMTGDHLVAKVRELRPELPSIICSGFSELLDEQRINELGIKGYLQKPLSYDSLLKAVAEALRD